MLIIDLLDIVMLSMIRRQPTHGFDIRHQITKSLGHEVSANTVYPHLNKLAKDGMIVQKRVRVDTEISNVGRVINVYEITDKGREYLTDQTLMLEKISDFVLLNTGELTVTA